MIKKTKRKRSKFPGIDKQVNLKIRSELIDHDYIHLLTDEEKDWLSRFNEEYISANFNHDGKRIHPKKLIKKKMKTKNKTKVIDLSKKDCEDMNNSRNRCILTRSKSNKMLDGDNNISQVLEKDRSTNFADVENDLIEKIDSVNFIDDLE